MRSALALALAVAACGCSSTEPRETGHSRSAVAPVQTPPASPASPAPRVETALSFVPAHVASKLGDANVVIAIDLQRASLGQLAGLIPDELACMRDVLLSAGVVVIASADVTEGFVTGLPEAATRSCMDALAPLFGATTSTAKTGPYELGIGGSRYTVAWSEGTATIREVGKSASGVFSSKRRAQIDGIPPSAFGWIVSGEFPKYKIEQSTTWIERGAQDVWVLKIAATGTEDGVARTWVESVVDGFREGAANKGIVVEDSWATVTSTARTANLEFRIPTAIFAAPRAAP